MNQTNLALPLAEKTNIKDWDFENLLLKDIPKKFKTEFSNFFPEDAENKLLLEDGFIMVEEIEAEGITISQTVEPVEESNRLIALNNEKRNSALSVVVEKNTKATLYIVHFSDERSLVHQSHIRLETGAELELIETFMLVGSAESTESYNANIVTKVDVGSNASLNSSVIKLAHHGLVYQTRLTEVHENGRFNGTNFILDYSDMVFEDFAHLVGKGSEANVATMAIADKSQKRNITVRVENFAPHSNGNIVNYGVVKDTAHLAFNGVGKIHKGMNGGDNQQETRLLNLSKVAQAIANPFLLIDEGDITAGHAASIGQIDEEQVYYLMSRGLSKQESEKLIVFGFLAPFANKVTNESLKEELLESIEEKLG
ncbi:MAG: SufD family Fe-S cluster assembly protein [Defluviitaleaceae bacterium]|nr:SufD family Fe-S cluster assembly protein [Defluviitaleaceae bacterium]